MSPRKDILRQLSRTDAPTGRDPFTRPSDLSGFDREPEKYQMAVNRLLQDRLIEGKKDEGGHMAIALNPHKQSEIRRELRAPWASPVVWAALTVAAALVAFFVLSGGTTS
ncbi:MAG: hypothetical protein PVI57_04550 [Gemmatimonadota bacterium]|jgi:hypothetical protein